MVAREQERIQTELQTFRVDAWERLVLAAIAFGLALGASQLRPTLAIPLLFGGIFLLVLGVRSLVLRWDLIDRLTGDRDALAIADVRRRAEQAATMESRRALSSSIHALLDCPNLAVAGRVQAVADDLELLAQKLDDDGLTLEPTSAVACDRLLRDSIESPLRNSAVPPEDVRARIAQILTGFHPRAA